jgi:predicted HD superfamily hydrolase involved in NAD metabolism
MKTDEAIILVKSRLSTKRFEHSLRVAETARELAKRYGVHEDKAELAAILHDYAKDFAVDKLKEFVIEGGLSEDLLLYHHELWHGPVGSYLLKTKHGITDQEVLDAIEFHTTGRAQMSRLELVVYVADYIEPGRQFPGVEEVRKISQEDLNRAAWIVSRNTIQFLLQKSALVYPHTIHVYNDLRRRL